MVTYETGSEEIFDVISRLGLKGFPVVKGSAALLRRHECIHRNLFFYYSEVLDVQKKMFVTETAFLKCYYELESLERRNRTKSIRRRLPRKRAELEFLGNRYRDVRHDEFYDVKEEVYRAYRIRIESV